jgi:hypothetical protein
MKQSKFKPIKIKCKNCKDIIWSKFDGDFTVCKCWEESSNKQNTMLIQLSEIIPGLTESYNGLVSKKPIMLPTKLGSEVISIIREYVPNKGIMIDQTSTYYRTAGAYIVVGGNHEKK